MSFSEFHNTSPCNQRYSSHEVSEDSFGGNRTRFPLLGSVMPDFQPHISLRLGYLIRIFYSVLFCNSVCVCVSLTICLLILNEILNQIGLEISVCWQM